MIKAFREGLELLFAINVKYEKNEDGKSSFSLNIGLFWLILIIFLSVKAVFL